MNSMFIFEFLSMPYKFIDVCVYTNIYTFFYTFFKSIDVFPSPQENHSRREQAVKVERRRKQQQEEESKRPKGEDGKRCEC